MRINTYRALIKMILIQFGTTSWAFALFTYSVLDHPIRQNISLLLGIFDCNGLTAAGLLLALGWFPSRLLGGGSAIVTARCLCNNRKAPIEFCNERINRFINEGIGIREEASG